MDHNTIAKLMRKKTGSYFKLSMALFFFAVFVLASYVVYIQYQFQQAGQTVTDNSNSHMIEVQGRQRSGGYHDLECLRFQDKEVALEILNGLDGLDESAIVFSYMINFGFSDQNGQVYFLKGYGVPAVGKRFLLEDVGEGAAYCSPKKGKGDIELLVPEVKIEEAGCVGGKTRGFRLALKPLENKSVLFGMPQTMTMSYMSTNKRFNQWSRRCMAKNGKILWKAMMQAKILAYRPSTICTFMCQTLTISIQRQSGCRKAVTWSVMQWNRLMGCTILSAPTIYY